MISIVCIVYVIKMYCMYDCMYIEVKFSVKYKLRNVLDCIVEVASLNSLSNRPEAPCTAPYFPEIWCMY